MKIPLLAALLFSIPSFAATYDCSVETNSGRTPLFQIDFDKQESAVAKVPQVGEVGCVVLRLYPEVFSCSIAFGGGKSLSAVAELGSAVLRLQADSPGTKLAVQCSKAY